MKPAKIFKTFLPFGSLVIAGCHRIFSVLKKNQENQETLQKVKKRVIEFLKRLSITSIFQFFVYSLMPNRRGVGIFGGRRAGAGINESWKTERKLAGCWNKNFLAGKIFKN